MPTVRRISPPRTILHEPISPRPGAADPHEAPTPRARPRPSRFLTTIGPQSDPPPVDISISRGFRDGSNLIGTYDPTISRTLVSEAPTLYNNGEIFKCPPIPLGTPDWFLPTIKKLATTKCASPSPHLFRFDATAAAAVHNSDLITQYGGLAQAIKAQEGSAVYFGSEFRPVEDLEPLFGRHPLWSRMKKHLTEGGSYPLDPIEEDHRLQDLEAAIEYGNHKSTEKRVEAFQKLVSEEITRGFYLPVTLECVRSLPGAEMAPQGIVIQNSINEKGEVIQKDRVTHDQSFKWPTTGGSVNDRIRKDMLTDVVFGDMLRRVVHYVIGCRQRHPEVRILCAKTDFSKAYKRCHYHPSTAVKCITNFTLQDLVAALVALRLTFGGMPCPSLWCDISEPICDLTNDLLRCDDWDPDEISSPVQHLIPEPRYMDDDIPFAPAFSTIVEIPAEDHGKADLYIDDQATVLPDLGWNLQRGKSAAALSAHLTARPLDKNEHIERDDFLATKKLIAEAGLAEDMTLLGWDFDTRRLVISLPHNKFVAWTRDIDTIIESGKTSFKDVEALLGRLNHAGHVIPLSRHFLSRIRAILYRASHRRTVPIREPERLDLILWRDTFLPAALKGVNMNLLTYRIPTHIYRSDACEHCMGGYSASGRAWRWVIPAHLQDRAHIGLLEFLGSIIGHGLTSSKATCPHCPSHWQWETAQQLQAGSENPTSTATTRTTQLLLSSSWLHESTPRSTSKLKPPATANGSLGHTTSSRTLSRETFTFPPTISPAFCLLLYPNSFRPISKCFHCRKKFPAGCACCSGRFLQRRDRRLFERKASSQLVSLDSISPANRIHERSRHGEP